MLYSVLHPQIFLPFMSLYLCTYIDRLSSVFSYMCMLTDTDPCLRTLHHFHTPLLKSLTVKEASCGAREQRRAPLQEDPRSLGRTAGHIDLGSGLTPCVHADCLRAGGSFDFALGLIFYLKRENKVSQEIGNAFSVVSPQWRNHLP